MMQITRRNLLSGLVVVSALAAAPISPAFAGGKVNASFLRHIAVDGYDTVAYFTDGKPVKGSSDFEVDWNGATWRFANADHAKMFRKMPVKYAPQYGGYCAWAVSQGYTADADPTAWKIVNGKLYLNYSADVQATWVKDIPGNITKADANWPKIEKTL